jgi:hypothetical protein
VIVSCLAISLGVDPPDRVGDDYLFARLRRMADPGLRHPFLALAGNPAVMRGLEARLTATGVEALAGRANFVALNGIDDWIGGVHLKAGQGRLWFRDRDTLVAEDG